MNRDFLPDPNELAPLLEQLSSAETDPETVVLRTHLVVERFLHSILAIRLDIEPKHLPVLQYLQLAKLALGGRIYNKTLLQVLALNDLRNKYVHEVTTTGIATAIERFASRTGVFCPAHAHDTSTPEFTRKVHQAILRLAGIACLTEVWMRMTELMLSNKLFSSEDAARDAASRLDEIRGKHAIRLEEQRRLINPDGI